MHSPFLKKFNTISLSFVSVISIFVISFSGCGGGSSNSLTPDIKKLDDGNHGLDTDGSEVGDKDSTFTLYLKTKKEFAITTNYEYDKDGYLLKSTKSDSSSGETTISEYRYFENHKIIKVYEGEILVKLATFVSRSDTLNYNAATGSRLSLSSQKNYFYHSFDTVINHDSLQVKSIITDMRHGLNYTDIFNYDTDGLLIKSQEGHYTLSSDVQSELSNDNNTSFLLENNETLMPFSVAQAQNYLYQNDTLKTIQFDNDDDGVIEVSSDVNVTYYPSGLIKKIDMSTGDSWDYNIAGILTESKRAGGVSRYTYSDDYKNITVTGADGVVVKQYIFDEIKGN